MDRLCYLALLLFLTSVTGQLIASWHPMTSFASVQLVECPNIRGQFWSCVPVAACNTLRPRSNRQYCRWDGTEPFVCCPHHMSQPLIQPRCGTLYSEDSYGRHDQMLGAAIGGIPLRTAMNSPWMVAIGERQQDDSVDWYCGGSLLQADTVLTAAHCPDEKDADPEDVLVAKINVHPNYKPPKYYNDIAILRLSHSVEYSRYVRPICLPDSGSSESYVGAHAVLTGWGYLSFGGERSPVLQEVSVIIFNNSDCTKAYSSPPVPRRNYPEGIISSQLCAGDPNGGKDACQGDSGGPLVVQNGGYHVLVGIVSSGIGCGSKAFPGVYSRVSSYVDWINKYLR
ncbi:Venom serine protease Bi-VSP [Blattella germanica]|nr:Venom serine protease Bi-VSP [Blattella germanica]